LVIWEAQFGDFANGAQVVIDQFIASGETKWGRACGLTLLLPHGYEGQGPEHSSARLERFLQLCAENNMQVCQPSTPAQIFHLLRRQMIRPFRKPLVVMTPKSLLRNKEAVSSLSELARGEFHTIMTDPAPGLDASKVRKLVFSTGKAYYDLALARRERELSDVALVRIEQLYPFPEAALAKELRKYPNATKVVWCQDEPQNQGSWTFIQPYLQAALTSEQHLSYAGRPASASPAVGYYDKHYAQQSALLNAALGEPNSKSTTGRSRAKKAG
jgi:2-oxoglutarate dehydrogenase E1 component